MDEPKNFTVLVVDDFESLRNLIAYDFRKKGFRVLTAEGGSQALEIIKTTKIDIVLSDMHMPCGNGLALLDSIREFNSKIPAVIIITGYSEVEQECISHGASQVFLKPYDRKALMSAVLESLGIHQEKAPTLS